MPSRFTLRQLEYLIGVADLGSISLAAERLNISAPSVSAAIGQIEAALGLDLFVRRHAQGLSLNEAGRTVVTQARLVLAEAGRLQSLAGEVSGTMRGSLSVGGLLTIAHVVLPALRRSFATLYPEVEFRQTEGHHGDLIAALRAASIDLALTYDLLVPSDIAFQPLIIMPPYAILPAEHALARQDVVSLRELHAEPMVLIDLPHSVDYFLQLFAGQGLRPRIAERTREIAVMHSLVANGFGYSIANVRPWTDLSPDGLPLRFIPIARPVRPMRFGLATIADIRPTQTLRAFTDHCTRHITHERLAIDMAADTPRAPSTRQ